MVENLWAVVAPPLTPLGELTTLPIPIADGEGACCHSPRDPSRSRPSEVRPWCLARRSNEKSWTRPCEASQFLTGNYSPTGKISALNEVRAFTKFFPRYAAAEMCGVIRAPCAR